MDFPEPKLYVKIIDRFFIGALSLLIILFVYGIFSKYKELLIIGVPFGIIIGIYILGTIVMYVYNLIKKIVVKKRIYRRT